MAAKDSGSPKRQPRRKKRTVGKQRSTSKTQRSKAKDDRPSTGRRPVNPPWRDK